MTGKREQSVESKIWKAEQRQCRLIVWELGWPAGKAERRGPGGKRREEGDAEKVHLLENGWEGVGKRTGWEKEGRGGFQRGKSTTFASGYDELSMMDIDKHSINGQN